MPARRSLAQANPRRTWRQYLIGPLFTLIDEGVDSDAIGQLPGAKDRNPLVLATFNANAPGGPRKRVLFYGHYECVPSSLDRIKLVLRAHSVVKPGPRDQWTSDPFELSARNGYIYARGVTDNKGALCADR